MFGKKMHAVTGATVEDRNEPKVPSIISADMTVRGDLIGAGDLQIEGNVIGRIDCDHLVIAANGSVEGDVVAKAVMVSGVLDGSLSAANVTLVGTCHVQGEIEYENLVVEAGARLDAHCRHLAPGARAELVAGTTESAVETTLNHLSSVPRRVA